MQVTLISSTYGIETLTRALVKITTHFLFIIFILSSILSLLSIFFVFFGGYKFKNISSFLTISTFMFIRHNSAFYHVKNYRGHSLRYCSQTTLRQNHFVIILIRYQQFSIDQIILLLPFNYNVNVGNPSKKTDFLFIWDH